jgi:uncharacterized membrane protein YagU involved in acid resistance
VLEQPSFSNGVGAAALGLLLQWAMSCLIAAIYVFAAYKLGPLPRSWRAAGVAYGLVVFVVMNYVVMPLSAVGRSTSFTVATFAANLFARAHCSDR